MDLKQITALGEQLKQRSNKAKSGATSNSWYRISNVSDDTTAVYLFDMIGDWGISASDFVAELNQVETPNIDLHVNSPGGEVFDAIAIFTALRAHEATVTAYVDSLAASAASFVVQAADKRLMEPESRLMIHDARGLAMGTAEDMRETADLLDQMSATIAGIYAERSGGRPKKFRDLMLAETWLPARAAVKIGLADQIVGDEDKDEDEGKPGASWDFDIDALIKDELNKKEAAA